jgi:hypothetical protein
MTLTTHITFPHRTRMIAGLRTCVAGVRWTRGSSMRKADRLRIDVSTK